jgi:aldose 1-epimerase
MLNSPEWGRLSKQISGPGDEYHWESAWEFGTV